MKQLIKAKPNHRKAYFEIVKALEIGTYNVVILLGLRKTGKTEILKQLAVRLGGFYHNFKETKVSYEDTEAIFERDETLLLFDEVGYLENFDLFFGTLSQRAAETKKQVVITSSSYGALKQLGRENLGGGRSYKVELFPLSFEEYLYFSGRIPGYGAEYEPTMQDVDDFYRLKHIPPDMAFVIDRRYMEETFTDNDSTRANYYHAERDIALTKEQYISVLDIIAYTLNDNISMKRLVGAQIGKQEFLSTKGIPMSQSLIGLANKVVNKMARDIEDGIGIGELAHIVLYMYHAGFLFVDLIVNEDKRQISDNIVHDLARIKTYEEFKRFFTEFNFNVISPLIYTRLLVDLEGLAGKIYESEHLRGLLYELAVKSESVYQKGYDIYHGSHKYKTVAAEVDLWERGLFLEATITHKTQQDHYVDKVLRGHELIRVLTDDPKECAWNDNGIFYRIGYPRALLMISNGSIRNLEARKVDPDIKNVISADPYQKPFDVG